MLFRLFFYSWYTQRTRVLMDLVHDPAQLGTTLTVTTGGAKSDKGLPDEKLDVGCFLVVATRKWSLNKVHEWYVGRHSLAREFSLVACLENGEFLFVQDRGWKSHQTQTSKARSSSFAEIATSFITKRQQKTVLEKNENNLASVSKKRYKEIESGEFQKKNIVSPKGNISAFPFFSPRLAWPNNSYIVGLIAVCA